MHTALDATDYRQAAECYRHFLGLHYRSGDEPPGPGDADAVVLFDRSADADEPLYVLAGPADHPFCLLVASDPVGSAPWR